MSLSKYKAILFDLDGTLLDTRDGILHSVRFTIEQLGYDPLPESILLRFVGPPIQESFQRYLAMTAEQAQAAANMFRDFYKEHALFEAQLYDGIIPVLCRLRDAGMKIAVATYKREDYAIDILRHFGVSEFCDVIHGADNDNRLTKADIVEMCISELGVDKSQVLLIGDTDHDAKGAETANVDFAAVTWGFGYTKESVKSDYPINYVYNSPCEILNLL